MPAPDPHSLSNSPGNGLPAAISRIVLAYAVLAGLWVGVSDLLVAWRFDDPARITLASTLKGGAFVLVTSLLLYGLLRRLTSRGAAAARQAQTDRQRALRLLAAIVDNSDDAIFAKDLDGRYILFNRAACDFVGKTVDEVLGQDDLALFPAAQAEVLLAIDRQVVSDNRPITREESLDTPDGPRIFLATKGPLRDEHGTVIGSFGISRDITASKSVEQALRERLAVLDRLNLIAISAPGLICSWKLRPDGSSCMPYASPAIVDQFGLTPEDVAEDATPFYARVHPDDVKQVAERVAESARTMTAWHDIYRYLHPAKGERWMEGWSMPREEEGGSIVWHGISMDITEHKKTEIALSDLSERLRTLLDAIPDLVWLKDGEGVYLACNPRFESLVGAQEAALLGKTDFDLFPRELAEYFRANDRAALAASQPVAEVEGEVSFADGHREILQPLKTPVRDGAGRLVGVLGIARDITAVKAAETELRARNAELERFNRAGIGRELDMIELKKQVNELSRQLGREAPYPLAFLEQPDA